jgi:hypothetical protein
MQFWLVLSVRWLPHAGEITYTRSGALHHIICRGIERQAMFEDDDDRGRFAARLASILEEWARCR